MRKAQPDNVTENSTVIDRIQLMIYRKEDEKFEIFYIKILYEKKTNKTKKKENQNNIKQVTSEVGNDLINYCLK